MDALNILFGAVTCIAFGLSAYQYLRSRRLKIVEKAKAEVLLVRLQSSFSGIRSVLALSDLIVQRAKERESKEGRQAVTIDELQSLARGLRAQAYTIARELSKECGRMRNWKLGVMTPTNDLAESQKADEADNETEAHGS